MMYSLQKTFYAFKLQKMSALQRFLCKALLEVQKVIRLYNGYVSVAITSQERQYPLCVLACHQLNVQFIVISKR